MTERDDAMARAADAGAGRPGKAAGNGIGRALEATPTRRLLAALAAILVLGAIAVATTVIVGLRLKTLDLAEQELRRINSVLADQTARTVRSVDVVLRSSAQAYEARLAAGTGDGREIQELLVAHVESIRDVVRAHGVIDAAGDARYSTRSYPAPSVNAADRDYFSIHRDHPEVGLLVTGPVQSRAGGEWALYLTRRLDMPDGTFAGVVFALIDPRYFETLFESLGLGDDSALALLIGKGTLVARHPPVPEATGRSYPSSFVFGTLLRDSDRGSGRTAAGALDRQPRVISAQRIPDLPLSFVVSRREADILASWERQTWIIALGSAAAIAVLMALVAALFRQLRRQERTAAALRDASQSLEAAQAVAHLGSWTWDAGTNAVSCSAELMKILGVSSCPAFADAFELMRRLHAGDPSAAAEAAAKLHAGERIQRLEARIVRPDGEVRWIETDAAPTRNAAGRMVRLFGTMLDVTERKRVEAELRQAQKLEAAGRLTGGVAHDFNNLLAVITGNLELAEESLGDRDDVRALLRTAIRASERGATLTRSLLAFARRQPLSPAPIDVKRLVVEVSDLIRRTVPATISIEIVSGIGLWRCEADPGQLQNALLNLVVNACDAMPDGGRLTIETGNARLDDDYAAAHAEVAPGQYVMLAVSDTGRGMSPDVASRAYEPFFTTKGAGKGTGLGLSMVYGFAKQSGGHVMIYSEPDEGTTVRIYLPRSANPAEAPAPRIAATESAGRGETVLVVEDDPDVRTLTFALLRSLGYDVAETGRPEEAVRMVSSNPRISLLLTDVILPGMNGAQLAEAVRELRPDIKVLYMSGYTQNAIMHHGRLDPGTRLLQKPFTKQELAMKVRTTIDGEAAA